MSTLQYELLQTTSGLSDVSMAKLIDYARTYIVPFDSFVEKAGKESLSQSVVPQARPRRLGSRKGVRFVAEGHDIDDYNEEIEELFGVSD